MHRGHEHYPNRLDWVLLAALLLVAAVGSCGMSAAEVPHPPVVLQAGPSNEMLIDCSSQVQRWGVAPRRCEDMR